MGNRFSRQNEGVENIDVSTHPYRYPPNLGKNFFADYFLMGGSKFDTPQPEAYLFGENSDLNLLNPKPVSFPYRQPPDNEPTKTLRSLVNLRKDSLRLVKSLDQESFGIEFMFDADVKCAVTVHYRATEDLSTGLAIYTSQEPLTSSPTTHFPKGSGQVYNSSPKHKIRPSLFSLEELDYCPVKHTCIPVVIQIDADEEEYLGHSNITLATFEKMSDGSFIIKPIKQKQMVDGLCYLLQEIYGIENKVNLKSTKDEDNELEETGLECVICMSDMRDTLILPCRHLCLCRDCAESLRYQASNCPICRSPFHALLQICAYIKKQNGPNSQETAHGVSVWPGYEEIPLVEALNGTIKPDNIPEEAVARMRRRSASSVRSSGRRRVESARGQRYVERSLSACSGMSRPSTAPVSRGRIEQVEEPARVEQIQRQEATLVSKSVLTTINNAEIEEATSVHEEEQVVNPVPTKEVEQFEDAQDLQVHVDISLPGTPLSSDVSGRSSLSAGSASATTPTYIRLEEGTGEVSVTVLPT